MPSCEETALQLRSFFRGHILKNYLSKEINFEINSSSLSSPSVALPLVTPWADLWKWQLLRSATAFQTFSRPHPVALSCHSHKEIPVNTWNLQKCTSKWVYSHAVQRRGESLPYTLTLIKGAALQWHPQMTTAGSFCISGYWQNCNWEHDNSVLAKGIWPQRSAPGRQLRCYVLSPLEQWNRSVKEFSSLCSE